jgi:hypothetical protein
MILAFNGAQFIERLSIFSRKPKDHQKGDKDAFTPPQGSMQRFSFTGKN